MNNKKKVRYFALGISSLLICLFSVQIYLQGTCVPTVIKTVNDIADAQKGDKFSTIKAEQYVDNNETYVATAKTKIIYHYIRIFIDNKAIIVRLDDSDYVGLKKQVAPYVFKGKFKSDLTTDHYIYFYNEKPVAMPLLALVVSIIIFILLLKPSWMFHQAKCSNDKVTFRLLRFRKSGGE